MVDAPLADALVDLGELRVRANQVGEHAERDDSDEDDDERESEREPGRRRRIDAPAQVPAQPPEPLVPGDDVADLPRGLVARLGDARRVRIVRGEHGDERADGQSDEEEQEKRHRADVLYR